MCYNNGNQLERDKELCVVEKWRGEEKKRQKKKPQIVYGGCHFCFFFFQFEKSFIFIFLKFSSRWFHCIEDGESSFVVFSIRIDGFFSFLGEIVISARDDDERGVAAAAANERKNNNNNKNSRQRRTIEFQKKKKKLESPE